MTSHISWKVVTFPGEVTKYTSDSRKLKNGYVMMSSSTNEIFGSWPLTLFSPGQWKFVLFSALHCGKYLCKWPCAFYSRIGLLSPPAGVEFNLYSNWYFFTSANFNWYFHLSTSICYRWRQLTGTVQISKSHFIQHMMI